MIKHLNAICWVYIRLHLGLLHFQTTVFCSYFSIARAGSIGAHELGTQMCGHAQAHALPSGNLT